MSSDEEQRLSIWLSSRMRRAGFTAANAQVQSAMATVLQVIVQFVLKLDRVHVFGSFADGWGSCLTRLDGRVDRDSDIDVTMIVEGQSLYLNGVGAPQCKPDCNHRLVEYQDGHVNCPSDVPGPNIPISRSDMAPAIDLITAAPCCSYPPIELLQPGRSSHINDKVMKALSEEILKSPRCHAVAASPPGLERSRMRVSTTLLEKLVMQHLTTVQGQFFVLLKFLIKKVISERVTGLKTYMAKNLLFYMLDDTPEKDWQPQNLLALVRQSLQILAAMMESTTSSAAPDSGDHVCMTHFFLRDASVYLKSGHRRKQSIVAEIVVTSNDLPNLLTVRFADSLAKYEVNAVHFHEFRFLFFVAEFVESESQASELGAYEMVRDAHAAVNEVSDTLTDHDLSELLRKIDALPDCVKLSRECLRVAAYLNAGRRLEDVADTFEFSVSRGIKCQSDANDDSLLRADKARSIVLELLQEVRPIRLQVSDGRVCDFMMKQELSAFVQLLRTWNGAQRRRKDFILMALMAIPQFQRFTLAHIKSSAKLCLAIGKGTRYIASALQGFASPAVATSADETPAEVSHTADT